MVEKIPNLGIQMKHMKSIMFALFVFPLFAKAQMSKRDSLWLTLKPFIGEWKGEGGGEPGKGKYERSYRFILNKRFIEIKNKSTYEPTTQHPDGEVHEDIGYFSMTIAEKLLCSDNFTLKVL